MIRLTNPTKIDARLITDPLAPIPPSLGKRDRLRLAELREAYTFAMQERVHGISMDTPETVAELFRPLLMPLAVESMAVVALNPRLQPKGPPVIITRGDVDGVDAGPRAILRTVLVQEGVSFIVAHNHPSGDANPSSADRAVTSRLITAGRVIDCPLMDHVIIGAAGRSYSLRRMEPSLWNS